jgi:hypothetical protein
LKNVIIYALLAAIAFQAFGISVLELQRYQNYLSRFLRHNDTATVIVSDVQKQSLHFINADEFEWQGKHYDVICSKTTAHQTEYLCKVDVDDEHLATNTKNHQNKKETNKQSPPIVLFCHQPNAYYFHTNIFLVIKKIPSFNSAIFTQYGSIEAPPPKV